MALMCSCLQCILKNLTETRLCQIVVQYTLHILTPFASLNLLFFERLHTKSLRSDTLVFVHTEASALSYLGVLQHEV